MTSFCREDIEPNVRNGLFCFHLHEIAIDEIDDAEGIGRRLDRCEGIEHVLVNFYTLKINYKFVQLINKKICIPLKYRWQTLNTRLDVNTEMLKS